MSQVHIDLETFSSIDIRTAGAYRYTQSLDFQIILVAYAFGSEPVTVVDLASGEKLPLRFTDALLNPEVEKFAHQAVFERQAFRAYGFDIPAEQWVCSANKAAYCGLPLALGQVSAALRLGDSGKAKLKSGRELIKYFCIPCKPTKANGGRRRNYPRHDLEKWEEFKTYCIGDVEAEREICRRLRGYTVPIWERRNYVLDQKINDRGVLLDLDGAAKAVIIDEGNSLELKLRAKRLTGLANPNSPAQLKKWFSDQLGINIKTLDKGAVLDLLSGDVSADVREVLGLRQQLGKSSTKKYKAMPLCAGHDNRARGLFQFYGANRTGRWAGRLIQVQNLPQNKFSKKGIDIEDVREALAYDSPACFQAKYPDVSGTLSQLIRTMLIAPPGHTFAVADFSAIEARVLAWLAGEEWRMEVFRTHGKIYEASAASMFNVPIEAVTKESGLRAKGKVAELALGYQGSVGALKTMGGEAMGLSEPEMKGIVDVWRRSNPRIKAFWYEVEKCATRAMKSPRKTVTGGFLKNLEFHYDRAALTVKLPSGRSLFYWAPKFGLNKFGKESIQYRGTNAARQWIYLDTYGGKLTENIVQAVARDLLAHALQELDKEGFRTVFHVHDEAGAEVPLHDSVGQLQNMCRIMAIPPVWAADLPLGADGYVTPFYKKD
jgi:DNA polymerase